jgi:hypothetical protein
MSVMFVTYDFGIVSNAVSLLRPHRFALLMLANVVVCTFSAKARPVQAFGFPRDCLQAHGVFWLTGQLPAIWQKQ